MFIGVDVGGTNSDCVIIQDGQVLAWTKEITSQDITTGVKDVVAKTLQKLDSQAYSKIQRISLGTTHFLNAVIQKRGLARVSVIRLCGPASRALPPFIDITHELNRHIKGDYYMVDGGFYISGQEFMPINEKEIVEVAKQIKVSNVRNVVVSGLFSPHDNSQEEKVASILRHEIPEISLTLSHAIGQTGLLERENASILNECLKPLCSVTLSGLQGAMKELNLDCPLFLTQNDGTLVNVEKCLAFPVCTFASGPTNSMRGAAFLSQKDQRQVTVIKNAIVADIGGTSTDVGQLIAGVLTNFRMPLLLSIGLGGGSHVSFEGQRCTIGPLSVGCKLLQEAQCVGGTRLTTSDVMVKAGILTDLGDPSLVQIEENEIKITRQTIMDMLSTVVDQIKVSAGDSPLIIVGGGGVLIDRSKKIPGISEVIFPDHYQVANAVGAALAQVSGQYDRIITNIERAEAVKVAKKAAIRNAFESGAKMDTIEIVEMIEIPVSYLPGNATRYSVKAVGDLDPNREKNPKLLEEMRLPYKIETHFGQKNEDQSQVSTLEDVKPELQGYPYSNKEDPHTWIMNEYDIEAIAIGAAILGCGGGGSSYLGKIRAQHAIRQGKILKVIRPENLPIGHVTPVAFFGAPTAIIEKLMNGNEGNRAVSDLEKILQYKSVAIGSVEIGGMNSLEPLMVGGDLGLPVLDADGMGRAFPELQMYLPLIKQHSPTPALVTDEKECTLAVTKCDSAKHLEDILRAHVVSFMGFSGVMSLNPIHSHDVRDNLIFGSYTKAWNLGHAILESSKLKSNPLEALLESVDGSKIIGSGKITDIKRDTVAGFARGFLIITPFEGDSQNDIKIEFQNENLIASTMNKEQTVDDGSKNVDPTPKSQGEQILATTPNLISIIETTTGLAIETECLKYGLRVSVIVMPSPKQLLTPEALAVVGPKAFGYQGVEVVG
ncbi:hypothetical protein TCAL_09554 [Tigriopus californicus]|uniref:Hydantoinase/oxoprolinase N-terminal domain-containing protein n=1 Tax=Tigriopus californicus TaxID=6832 RepID=A0A553P2D5_TIGCA|nr:hypothetical protein TCAL_09554 [Tigriopus californicus]